MGAAERKLDWPGHLLSPHARSPAGDPPEDGATYSSSSATVWAPWSRRTTMETTQPAQPALAPHPHANRRLFSDHYLDVLLPESGEWKLGRDRSAALLARVRDLYRGFTPSTNEAQTERELVHPVLELLG